MDRLHNAFTLFLSLLVEAIPFLLLGVFLSSAMLIFIDERQLIAKMPRNPFFGALIGSCAGFLFPVCECGNVPVARRLLIQGVPTAVATGFLLAAPTINPIVIWSTWAAFPDRPQIVILRVLFSLIIATTIGCVFSVQKELRPILQPMLAKRIQILMAKSPLDDRKKNKESNSPLLQGGTFILDRPGKPLRLDEEFQAKKSIVKQGRREIFLDRLDRFIENVLQELRELGAMLIIGSAIAAAIQVFVPREFIISLGQGTISSILAMLLLAAIVSICSTVDSFFALSFASTFTTSSLLAFLIFGPMIDIKGVGLMLSIFKPKTILYFFALAAQLTFVLTFSYSYFF